MTFVTSEFDRRVAAPTGTVNVTVREALRDAGFEIVTQQLTLIEARRGSRLAMVAMRRFRKLPMVASVRLTQSETGGSEVSVSFRDDWNSALLGLPLGLNGAYGSAFEETERAIDAALTRAAHVSGIRPAVVQSKQPKLGFYERASEAVNRFGERAIQKGNAVLAGEGGRGARSPWSGIDEVCLESDEGEARLALLDAQAMLMAGGLIAMRPGSMPDNLRLDVERFVARVENVMSDTDASHVTVSVAEKELPVVSFLRQQARIREDLEVRTLRTCKTCQQKKVINPDFQRLLKRNKRLKQLGGGFGASISSGGVTPFVLLGTVIRSADLDPDFVCGRCQGLEYEDALVTFCPDCGDMRTETALRTCPRCKHNFAKALAPETFWGPRTQPAVPLLEAGGEAAEASWDAGWYADPVGRHEHRYWDGSRWTEHAADAGQQSTDPL